MFLCAQHISGEVRPFLFDENVIGVKGGDGKDADPASANGVATADIMPTSENSNGPSNSKARQPFSHLTPSGTHSSKQTIESSSAVRVTEKRDAAVAHAGTPAVTSRRQIAR